MAEQNIIGKKADKESYVSHELHHGALDLGRHGSREDEGLLVLGSVVEDLLDILPHVGLLKHFVDLVNHEDLELRDIEGLVLDQSLDAARAAHDNMGFVVLEALLLLRQRHTTIDALHGDTLEVGLEALELLRDLVRQLPGMHNHHGLQAIIGVDTLQGNSHEDSRFAHTGLGLCDNIIASQAVGNSLLLNWNDQHTSTQYIRSQCPTPSCCVPSASSNRLNP
mmetsp:Transcript_91908/g.148367  ORF Transcript_91908/g.148367 Transcript_91908/m.148367 type:complete len:223 (-) Transcript_91908:808-1476(-)